MQTDDGKPLPADTKDLRSSGFGHFITPFQDLHAVTLSALARDTDTAFGLRIADDLVLSKPYISNIKAKSPASRLCSTQKLPETNIGVPTLLKLMESV